MLNLFTSKHSLCALIKFLFKCEAGETAQQSKAQTAPAKDDSSATNTCIYSKRQGI